MIDIKDVSYSYSDIKALNKINLHIKRGEAVAFLGANGSGKSTLLKLINGIIVPDSGVYKFNNEEITKKKLSDVKFAKQFHQKIGFIFQNSDVQLFCASVFDEISFGPRQMGFDEYTVNKRVNDCLDLLGIQDLKQRQPYHLSGGEKRKVAIACVLALNPEVIVLDEPMNGLDPRTQRWLVEFLNQLNEAGKTIITSTHSLLLVQEISRRSIIFSEEHMIVADMPTKEMVGDMTLLKTFNLIDERF